MSSISEESNDGPRVLKGTPFQQHYQILNFHEKRLKRLEMRVADGSGGNGATTASDQQVKMLVQHIQQLSRRLSQVEASCREAQRQAQTTEISMGQLRGQVEGLNMTVGTPMETIAEDIIEIPAVVAAPKQKGRKKKGKNVRLEVSEN